MKIYYYLLLILLGLQINLNAQNDCLVSNSIYLNNTVDLCNSSQYVAIYKDEFGGNSLNLNEWGIQVWAQGALYGPLNDACETIEYNTLDNVTVSNGTMKIIAKYEPGMRRAVNWINSDTQILSDGLPNSRHYDYTSSNIWNKYLFGYGKCEAMIKIPKGRGFWPAFWLYSGEPWNEIDIFEFWNEDNNSDLSKIPHFTAHYDYDNNEVTKNLCGSDYEGVDYSQDFHLYTVTWEMGQINWYIDNVLRYSYKRYYYNGAEVGCFLQPFTWYTAKKMYPVDPMSIIFNLAIQRDGNAPDGTTPLPSQLEVEYVKYYKKMSCATYNLTNPALLTLSSSQYNVVGGISATINCNYTVPAQKQLTILGNDYVRLLPGFHAVNGCDFVARTETFNCAKNGEYRDDSDLEILSTINNIENYDIKDDYIFEEIKKVSVFPNPNNGYFVIEGVEANIADYSVSIKDSYGKIIYVQKQLSSNQINISDFDSGIYFLSVYNAKTSESSVHKILRL